MVATKTSKCKQVTDGSPPPTRPLIPALPSAAEASVELRSGGCQTTPVAGLSAACQTRPATPRCRRAGCQTEPPPETPGDAGGRLSLQSRGSAGQRAGGGGSAGQRTGADGSLSRSDSSGHRSTASGEVSQDYGHEHVFGYYFLFVE